LRRALRRSSTSGSRRAAGGHVAALIRAPERPNSARTEWNIAILVRPPGAPTGRGSILFSERQANEFPQCLSPAVPPFRAPFGSALSLSEACAPLARTLLFRSTRVAQWREGGRRQ
jgi:hypothetical protein